MLSKTIEKLDIKRHIIKNYQQYKIQNWDIRCFENILHLDFGLCVVCNIRFLKSQIIDCLEKVSFKVHSSFYYYNIK